MRRAGRDQLEQIPSGLARYHVTHHAVSVATYAVEGDRATGDVTGVAHHVAPDGRADSARALDAIWYLRYLDEYVRADGGWLLTRRALHLRGIEERRVAHLGPGRP